MSDALIALVPEYGLWLIGIATFLSCLALPAPASLLMIGGGAFAAGGDLSIIATTGAALVGAILGDQTGFAIGRNGASYFDQIALRENRQAALVIRARKFFLKWGQPGVFLSRWLFSPLGPYVNFVGGATGLNWRAFTLWAAAGEVIWVTLYTGLGYSFSGQISMVADLAGNISGFLAALAVTLFLGKIGRAHV